MLQLSLPAARAILLLQQGLLAPPRRAAKKADVLACIRRMRVLQIDTISVVARSPYLVLFSRLGAYEPRWLEQLHTEGKLFEYWSHAMCWLPAEDWPLWRGVMLQRMAEPDNSMRRIQAWLAENRQAVDAILSQIRQHGPVKSADFKRQHDKGGVWWNWKLEKTALEFLFWSGELMISRREGFQRVYDLRERVLPNWNDTQAVPAAQARLELVRRSALALGPATEPWLRDYFRLRQDKCKAAIASLTESGELLPVEIEGVSEPAWLHRDLLPLAKKAQAGKLAPAHTALLSPFDPLVWDRRRNRQLFGFDYTIEIYTPEAKRRFGYFVLPILHNGQLVGRLCPKAHRKDGVFELRTVHLEDGVALGAQDWLDIASAVQDCADWHGTPQVKVGSATASGRQIRAALSQL